MSCQTGIEASQELREFLGGCRGGCTRAVKVCLNDDADDNHDDIKFFRGMYSVEMVL